MKESYNDFSNFYFCWFWVFLGKKYPKRYPNLFQLGRRFSSVFCRVQPPQNCSSDRSTIRLRCHVESGHVRIRFAATIIAAVRCERFSEFGSATFRQHQLTQIADSAHLAPLRVLAARMSEQTPRCRLDRRRRPRIGSADASGLWPKIQMLSEM